MHSTHSCDRLEDRRQEADGTSRRLNRGERGTTALRSLGRHTVLRSGRPYPLQYRAPDRCPCLSAFPKVGHPALRTPMLSPLAPPPSRLDAAPRPRCPTFAMQGQGRGCAAVQLSPTAPPTRGRVYFHWGENWLAAPQPPTCQLSWRQFPKRVGTLRVTAKIVNTGEVACI